MAAPVAEWVRSLYFSALNHSIISPLCLVQVRAPHWPHVRQDKFCLRVCQVVFLGYSRFAPPIDWLVSISEIILKGTLNLIIIIIIIGSYMKAFRNVNILSMHYVHCAKMFFSKVTCMSKCFLPCVLS